MEDPHWDDENLPINPIGLVFTCEPLIPPFVSPVFTLCVPIPLFFFMWSPVVARLVTLYLQVHVTLW